MNLRTTGLAIACVLVALVAAPDAGRSTTPAQAMTEPPHVPFAIRTAEIAAAVALRATPHPNPPPQGGRETPRNSKTETQRAMATRVMAAPAAAPGSITIPVPLYKQTMNLDCETASLEMALAYRGHWYSQAYLFSLEHADTRPAVKNADGSIAQWGNPFTNFVGNVHGAEHLATGYGIYYPPILWIARGLGDPGAAGGTGYSASTIYAALASGHPVQVWVEYQWVRPATGVWKAWDNTKVHYSLHEHTVVLSGLSGTQVRVNDPWPGVQYWIDKSTFERSWADFFNMAIIY